MTDNVKPLMWDIESFKTTWFDPDTYKVSKSQLSSLLNQANRVFPVQKLQAVQRDLEKHIKLDITEIDEKIKLQERHKAEIEKDVEYSKWLVSEENFKLDKRRGELENLENRLKTRQDWCDLLLTENQKIRNELDRREKQLEIDKDCYREMVSHDLMLEANEYIQLNLDRERAEMTEGFKSWRTECNRKIDFEWDRLRRKESELAEFSRALDEKNRTLGNPLNVIRTHENHNAQLQEENEHLRKRISEKEQSISEMTAAHESQKNSLIASYEHELKALSVKYDDALNRQNDERGAYYDFLSSLLSKFYAVRPHAEKDHATRLFVEDLSRELEGHVSAEKNSQYSHELTQRVNKLLEQERQEEERQKRLERQRQWDYER